MNYSYALINNGKCFYINFMFYMNLLRVLHEFARYIQLEVARELNNSSNLRIFQAGETLLEINI